MVIRLFAIYSLFADDYGRTSSSDPGVNIYSQDWDSSGLGGTAAPRQPRINVQVRVFILFTGQISGPYGPHVHLLSSEVHGGTIALKVAVTDLSLSIVRLQVPVPLQAPDQPAKVEPEFGAADKVSDSIGIGA